MENTIENDKAINPEIAPRYIVDSDPAKFRGWIQSSTYTSKDGVERIAYRDGETLESYLKENQEMRVITGDEMDSMLQTYVESLKTKPAEIEEDQYYYWLECLPPCRFDGNRFHISERLYGNLVQWCFKKNGKFYGFQDSANITEEQFRGHYDSV